VSLKEVTDVSPGYQQIDRHEKRRWHPHARPSIAAALLALLLATNVAADTTPGVFYACVNTRSGTIRMITASGTCLTPETRISWNQVGPAGPQGSQGPAGPGGPQGPLGPAGGNQHLTLTDVYAAPIAMYFLAVLLTRGIGWTIHSWLGSVVGAGICGLLLSYLVVPPPIAGEHSSG